VEDNAQNRDIVRRYLGGLYELLEAEDGEHGLERAGRDSPDLILMDLSLPRLDGWEATRRLRKLPAAADIPVIAVHPPTPAASTRRKAREVGCSDYLTKPLDRELLLETIADTWGGRMPEETPRIRVLVVDDDVDTLELVRRTLTSRGFEVHTHTSPWACPTWCATRRRTWCCWTCTSPPSRGQGGGAGRQYAPPSTQFILYSAADESRLRSLALASARTATCPRACRGGAAQKLLALRSRGRGPPQALS
jgi:CheY-like chemotaxis protein